MNEQLINSVAARWAKLGVMLNVKSASNVSDLEQLLLDTARVSSANSRLFTLAVTWLANFGQYVSGRRLAHLIESDLEKEFQPTLGLLLELAVKHSKGTKKYRFNSAIKACEPAREPHPLFDVERRNSAFVRLAKQRATKISRKWGRWSAEIELKTDAIRPTEWVASHNPQLARRAIMTDLQSQIMTECENAGGKMDSESELAMRCRASRPATRSALKQLELAGMVHTYPRGKSHVVEIQNSRAARQSSESIDS